jgi:hypothetical protein
MATAVRQGLAAEVNGSRGRARVMTLVALELRTPPQSASTAHELESAVGIGRNATQTTGHHG